MRTPTLTSIILSLLAFGSLSTQAHLHQNNHRDLIARLNGQLNLEARHPPAEIMERGQPGSFYKRQSAASSIDATDDDDDETTTAVTRTTAVTPTAVASTTVAKATTSAAPVVTSSSAQPAVTTTSQAGITTTSNAAPTTSSVVPTTTSAVVSSGSTPIVSSGLLSSAASSVRSSSSVIATSNAASLASSAAPVLSSATHTSTDAQGSVIYVTQVETEAATSTAADLTSYATVLETASASGANATSTATSKSEDTSGLSTGAIVGISVVAGVAVLGLILFIVWKMKQKRFSSFDDDDDVDGIKWPELNRHGESAMNLPLPAKPTGGHGFETNALERGRTDLDGNMLDDEYDDYNYPVSHAASVHDASPYYSESPPLGGNMSYSNTGVYGPGGTGVTRAPSSGAQTYLSSASEGSGLDRNRSLGGTRGFDMAPNPEMVEMTETNRNGGLGRNGSGRML